MNIGMRVANFISFSCIWRRLLFISFSASESAFFSFLVSPSSFSLRFFFMASV